MVVGVEDAVFVEVVVSVVLAGTLLVESCVVVLEELDEDDVLEIEVVEDCGVVAEEVCALELLILATAVTVTGWWGGR